MDAGSPARLLTPRQDLPESIIQINFPSDPDPAQLQKKNPDPTAIRNVKKIYLYLR